MKRILVTDDDPTIVLVVRRLLEEDGFVVDVADTSAAAHKLATTRTYDGLVLDLALPDGNGIGLIETLRRSGRHTPVLVLTGSQDTETTVRALDAGADAYVTKPIVADEFKARVRALIRRQSGGSAERITIGNTELNRLSRTLLVGGAEVKITPRQLALLEHLMLHEGTVVKREVLHASVHELRADPGTNVLDVNVSRLRQKLRAAGSTMEIKSKRNVGFAAEQGTQGTQGTPG
jgi:two-component system OmpR family response regulator